jgi:hypothetical protein
MRRFELVLIASDLRRGSRALPGGAGMSARPRRVSRKLTPSALAVDGKRHADRLEEFKHPGRLNENPGNIDQGIWEMVS